MSLNHRLKMLEKASGINDHRVALVVVPPGETEEEGWQRYCAEHPGAEHASYSCKLFIFGFSGRRNQGTST